jgi:hypothetical protein
VEYKLISVICFSKDRPLQLEAYLQSLIFYSGLPSERISVLYADSTEISYDFLRQRYPDINWRRESSFYSDLLDLVRVSQNYVLLGCDDVFFTDHFDLNVAMERLADDATLFGFSLRLGLNLHSLPDVRRRGDVLAWDWTRAATGHWSYPWDVSATLFRRSDVEAYLRATPEATNPNRLEAIRAKALQSSPGSAAPRLASFVRGKCLTLTVNRVQDEFPNDFDGSCDTDIHSLFQAHLAGKQLDWPRFSGAQNKVIHVDASYFRLCDKIVPPPLVLDAQDIEPAAVWLNHRHLRIKVFFWRYVVKLKELIRPYIPRYVMRILRKILQGG